MSRERILTRIKRALEAPTKNELATSVNPNRASASTPIIKTATDQGSARQRLEAKFKTQGILLRSCRAPSDLPSIVANILHATDQNRRMASIAIAPHPLLQNLNWAEGLSLPVHFGACRDEDQVGISVASGGVIESGALLHTSSAHNPTTLAFLPDVHICVLPENLIFETFDEGLRHCFKPARDQIVNNPRALNVITGASRTADIAGKIVQGAHGPRTLAVIILES